MTAPEVNKLDAILKKVTELETKVYQLEVTNQRERARQADNKAHATVSTSSDAKPRFKGNCNYCGVSGHKRQFCWKRKREQKDLNAKEPTAGRGGRGVQE